MSNPRNQQPAPGKQDWNTPPAVLDLVRQVAPIGLDPCSNPTSLVGAEVAWTEADDGLSRTWTGHGLVFVNPPFGTNAIERWARRIADEAAAGAEIIALLNACTDTAWFHESIATACVLCFWRGRVKFLDPSRAPGATSRPVYPNILGYWGPRPQRFREVFAPRGLLVSGANGRR